MALLVEKKFSEAAMALLKASQPTGRSSRWQPGVTLI